MKEYQQKLKENQPSTSEEKSSKTYYILWGIYGLIFPLGLLQEKYPISNKSIWQVIFSPLLLVFAPNRLMEKFEGAFPKTIILGLHFSAWMSVGFFIPIWLEISSAFIETSFLSSFIPDISAVLGLSPLSLFFLAAPFLYLALAQVVRALLTYCLDPAEQKQNGYSTLEGDGQNSKFEIQMDACEEQDLINISIFLKNPQVEVGGTAPGNTVTQANFLAEFSKKSGTQGSATETLGNVICSQ
jgi:hypothetical protein